MVMHRHGGTYWSRTPRGRTVQKQRPIHSQSLMKKNKSKTYHQLRKRFNIRPLADDDRDGKRNYEDCRPWDKNKQDIDYVRLAEREAELRRQDEAKDPTNRWLREIRDQEEIDWRELAEFRQNPFDTDKDEEEDDE